MTLDPLFLGMNDRQRGLVIYISSGSSTQPTPMQSSYAGGKRLLDILAQNLQREYPKITFQERTQTRFKGSSYFKMTSLTPLRPWLNEFSKGRKWKQLKRGFPFGFIRFTILN